VLDGVHEELASTRSGMMSAALAYRSEIERGGLTSR